MGSYVNFKNFGETAPTDGSGWNPPGCTPLARQSSIYSLTFDEFQNTLGESGKEFGSVNMEDLLKSIWTAEENQSIATCLGRGDGNAPNGNLQRQGSLTLPRTLSQKTVEEVWRDVLKDTIGVQDASTSRGSNLVQREPTLGEMTLEEFLVRAGAIREDILSSGGPTTNNVVGGLPLPKGNSVSLATEFQPLLNNVVLGHEPSHLNSKAFPSPSLGNFTSSVSMTGAVSQQPPQQPQPQLQPILPKQTTLSFSSPSNLGNNAHLASPRTKGSVVGLKNPSNNALVQGEAVGIGGLHNGVTVTTGSPRNHLHCDVNVKSNLDSPALSPSPSPSPSPYVFGELGGRGRRSATLEKVFERRQRRMIKNRESAARSRARKQAYATELEAEVAMLKEMNCELQKKQQEILEKQKNQILESLKISKGAKRRCLRRTYTGPW